VASWQDDAKGELRLPHLPLFEWAFCEYCEARVEVDSLIWNDEQGQYECPTCIDKPRDHLGKGTLEAT
jgi:hypothetical protein